MTAVYKCPYCGKQNSSEEEFKKHAKEDHPGEKYFICPHDCIPKVIAKSENGLQKHIASAHKEKLANEILIDGRKRIKTIQSEFTGLHPYLGIHFFIDEELEKAKKGETIHPLDKELSLAQARTKKATASEDFRVSNKIYLETMEQKFKEQFGLNIKICVKKQGKGFYRSGEDTKNSLKDLNEQCSKNGYEIFEY